MSSILALWAEGMHSLAPTEPSPQRAGVAIVPVVGPIHTGHAEQIADRVAAAVADDRVQAVVMALHTPGGTVLGLPEAHARILALRGQKPIIAQVNHMAASAGYWLASAADKIVASPSSMVGSIGVYSMHLDQSAMLEREGLKPTYIYAGRDKVLGNMFEPLTPEAQAYLQESVDDAYGQFTQAVSIGRGVSLSDVQGEAYANGRVVTAARGLERGMVDEVGTISDTLSRLGGMTVRANIRQRRLALLEIERKC